MKIREMKQKRTKLGADARALMDAVAAEGREMTSEEEQQFDRLMDERDKVDKSIERAERLDAEERAEDDPDTRDRGVSGGSEDAAESAFRAYIIGGRAALSDSQFRALNAGSDPEGGFLVAPQKFVQELLKAVDEAVPLRPLATVQTLTEAESLGVPTLATDLNDADWTSEVATGTQDDALRFGKRELRPNPLAKRVLASRTLLRKSTMGAESIVRERLAYKFSITQEKAYMTGDGNKKPLGLFTASAQGISTARDVNLGAAGALPLTNATSDQLIDAKYALKSQYHRRARWMFHRDVLKVVRKLKDGNGQYLWQPGLASDRPDVILDVPFALSEFAPNTIAANNYVGMIGDFSFYWIVDSLALEIQRLVELYAETNQVGFIGRAESDGMPTLEEPFIRLKVPA